MNKKHIFKLVIFNIATLLLVGFIYAFFDYGFFKDKSNSEVLPECLLTNYQKKYFSVNERYNLLSNDYHSDDEEIVSIAGKYAIANKVGSTSIKNDCNYYEVIVTDLINSYSLKMNKEYLPSNRYTKQENEILDTILKDRIAEKGYQSRAGAVEAARFLLLNFPYKLKYFYENGRIGTEDKEDIDGEGRYYHYGLYLNEDKFSEINNSLAGPAIWGNKLFQYETNELNENGLDCSGFITWALYNAGYDVKDIGAGPSEDIVDLTDLGKVVYIDELDIKDLKVGDLLGFDGHISMVVGIEGNNIYVGEAYWVNDLQVRIYSRQQFKESSEWEYAILMDNFYKQDGNLNNYWS